MEWLIVIANEWRHIFSIIAAEALLVLPTLKKKNRFALRVSMCLLACCLLGVLYAVLYMYLNDYMVIISIFWYTAIFILTGVFVFVCFEADATTLFWVMIAAYAVEHFVYVVVNEMVFIGAFDYNLFDSDRDWMFWVMMAAYCAVCAGVYFAFCKIFAKYASALGSRLIGDTWKTRIIFGAFLVAFFASTILNQHNTQNVEDGLNYWSAASDLFNCLFVLAVQYVTLRMLRISFEKRLADKLHDEEKKQYESFKNSVDYVNIKCHDLKHELRRIKKDGVSDEKLDEIAKGVELYEAFAQTGNETLDALLTEKNLACISEDIALLYMADGGALEFMEPSDIYSLFGNLLDNAVEHVRTVGDKEKRVIRLFVKSRGGGMLSIHEENVCVSGSDFVGGLPKTTKDDKLYHGYGIKSMRATARKYGGDLRVSVDDGMFKVDIFMQTRK